MIRVTWRKAILLAVAAAAAAIQFVPVDRSNPAPRGPIDAPPKVMDVLRTSCFDCHSCQTRWPWYSYVAPVSWFVAGHVDHARGEFNLSDWETIDPLERRALRKEMWKEVEEGEMPLPVYLVMHPGARLDETQRRVLNEWAAEADRPMPAQDAGHEEEAE